MRKITKDNVLVDRCPECNSIWLDSGELEMMEKRAGYEQAEIIQQARRELLHEAQRLVSIVGMCPKCERTKLHSVKRRGVEIDVCDNCGGIFFDEGELDQMLEGKEQSFFSSLLAIIKP